MRGKLLAATSLVCLAAAGTASAAGPITAAPNTYTGNFSVAGGAAGTVAKPKAVSMVETLGMGSSTAGNVGAPLVEIKTTTYGVSAPYAKYFPKCTASQINGQGGSTQKWNAVCPKGSLVATGTVNAALTSPTTNLLGPGAPCALQLWVYNAGPGLETFFFTTTPSACDGLTTGAAAAWTGKVYSKGKYLVTDTPEPADVSYNAGNVGLFGSLESETLNFKKLTVTHAGKVYPYLESIGCSKHTRPWTISYTATESNSGSPTLGAGTVSGTAGC
jgi:hypothetical protein